MHSHIQRVVTNISTSQLRCFVFSFLFFITNNNVFIIDSLFLQYNTILEALEL